MRYIYSDHSVGYGSQFQPTDVISASISNMSAYAIRCTIDSMSSGSTLAGAMSVHTTSLGFSAPSFGERAVSALRGIAIRATVIQVSILIILFFF